MTLALEVCETGEGPHGIHFELYDKGERVGVLSLWRVGDGEFVFESECAAEWAEVYLWDTWLAMVGSLNESGLYKII